jgi:Zn finger protein HypA/HybF involved in hydrogenase expression
MFPEFATTPEPSLEPPPIKVQCPECGSCYQPDVYDYECPFCGEPTPDPEGEVQYE